MLKKLKHLINSNLEFLLKYDIINHTKYKFDENGNFTDLKIKKTHIKYDNGMPKLLKRGRIADGCVEVLLKSKPEIIHTTKQKTLNIWTDSSYKPHLNNNYLSYASILKDGNITKSINGLIRLKDIKSFFKLDDITQVNINIGELLTLIKTIYQFRDSKNLNVNIHTDSTFCVDVDQLSIVTNKYNSMVVYYHKLLSSLFENNVNITIIKVKAHSGIENNEIADKIAKDTYNRLPTNHKSISTFELFGLERNSIRSYIKSM